jgi:hypothetical protein
LKKITYASIGIVDRDSMTITPGAWAGAEQESLATIAVAELRAVVVIMNDSRMSSLKESFQERGGDTAFRRPGAVD